MTISAADPTRLPKANLLNGPNNGIAPPNGTTLKARSWQRFYCKHPSVIVPVGTQAATIWLCPGKDGDAASATSLGKTCYSIPRGGLMFAPGYWHVFYDTTTTLDVVILDAYSNPAAMQLLGTFIAGTGGIADVRNADADADGAAALFGQVGNNRLWGLGDSEWGRLRAFASTATGFVDERVNQLAVVSFLCGQNTTAAAGSRKAFIEARTGSSEAGWLASTTGLVANVRSALVDAVGGTFVRALGILESAAGSLLQGVVQARKDGYWASLRGRRFQVGTDQTTTVAGTTTAAYLATTAQIVAVPAVDWVVRVINIFLTAVGGSGPVTLQLALDTDNEYSAGGTSRTPVNLNTASVAASAPTQCRDGAITLSNAPGRFLPASWFQGVAGNFLSYGFDDGILVQAGDTFAGYVFATAAPTFSWCLEYEEVDF